MSSAAETRQYSALPSNHTPTVSASVTAIPRNAILCVLGGFCIHLVLGMLYAWAVITAPVTSYLRQWDASTTYNDTILIFSITLTVQSGMMVIGGLLSDRLGARKCCALGSVFLVLSMFLASFCQSVLHFILFHAIPFGIGIGLCYTPPIATSVRWMPDRKGIVTGVIMCGLGIGAVILGLLCNAVVNPSHLNVNESGPDANYFPPDSPVVQKVPVMYRIVSLCFVLLLPLGCILMSDPPVEVTNTGESSSIEMVESSLHSTSNPINKNKDQARSQELEMGQSRHALLLQDVEKEVRFDNSDQVDEKAMDDKAVDNRPVQLSLNEVSCLALTWHLIACFTCTTGGGMYLLGTFKTFAQQDIHNERFLSMMGSFSTLSSSIGRIVWGLVSDRYGTLPTLMIAMLVFSVVIFTYPSSVLFGEVGFACWTVLIFFLEAANFAIYFPVVVSLFGASHAASNYGFVVTVYSTFFMALSYFIAKGNYDFRGACTIIGSVTFVGFLLVCTLRWRVSRQ